MEDMSEYRDIFLAELSENISLLNTSLLAAEKDRANSRILQDLVRAAHTIKGMAGTMGYDGLTKLTHEMESHLNSLSSLSPGIIQTLFKSADRLQSIHDAVDQNRDPDSISVTDLIQELRQGGDLTVGRQTIEQPEDELRQGIHYKLEINFDPKTQLRGPRGFQALRVIDSMAEITTANPPIEVLEDGKLLGDIEMEIISYESEAELHQAILAIGDIKEVVINRLLGETDSSIASIDTDLRARRKAVQSVRVNLDRLDRVVDLLGELVITRGRFQSLVDSVTPEVSEQFQIFDNTISTIQDTVMGLRMVNLSQIFDTYPRTVRDIAHSRGMEIELLLQGTHIQIDRSVVDQVNEALLHLVRNAAIHGIEDENTRKKSGKSAQGTIRLAARRERGEVVFEVEDDGSGLDLDKIRAKGIEQGLITKNTVLTRTQLASLIFRHGFSTAKEITEIAGRGVGMDIVKSTIDEISGTIEIRTKSGVGTRFIIRVPQTLAIIEGLIVSIKGHRFAVPLLNVEKIFSIRDPAIETHENRLYLNWQGENIRIINLEEQLNLTELITSGIYSEDNRLTDDQDSNGNGHETLLQNRKKRKIISHEKVILWERAGLRIGLLVSNVLQQREIVTKQLDQASSQIEGFSGATILGYDEVALILDPDALSKMN